MRRLLVVLSFCLTLFTVSGQQNEKIIGTPFVQNFKTADYKGEPQVNCVAQDSRGVLYFGHNSGLSVYDGADWRFIDVNEDGVQSIAINTKDEVFIGSESHFGWLASNSSGQLTYEMLSDTLDQDVSMIYGLETIGEKTYFSDYKALYSWQAGVVKIEAVTNEESQLTDIYEANGELYVYLDKQGLFDVSEGKLVPRKGNENIKGFKINDVLAINNDTLLLVISEALFCTPANDFNPKLFEISYNGNGFLKGLIDDEISDIFLTVNGVGIVRLDAQGQLLEVLDVQNDLISTDVNDFIFTKDRVLAVSTGFGISLVNVSSPIRKVALTDGIFGPLEGVFGLGDLVYVVGKEGLFEYRMDSLLISEIDNLGQSGYGGGVFDSIPFFILNDGVFVLGNEELEFFSEDWAWSLLQYDENTLIVGSDNEVVVYSNSSGEWLVSQQFPISGQCKPLAIDKEGNVWSGISRGDGGLFKLTPKSNKNEILFDTIYYSNDLIGSDGLTYPFIRNGEVYFGSPLGVLELENDKFKITENLGSFVANFDNTVTLAFEDLTGRLWLSTVVNKENRMGYIGEDGEYHYAEFAQLSDNLIYSMYSPNMNEVWMAGPGGLYIYRPINKQETSFNVLCRSIRLGDSIVYGGDFKESDSYVVNEIGKSLVFDYSKTALEFTFSAPFFSDVSGTQYSYYLKGFDENWSEWKADNKISYTNIPKGKYELLCKVKTADGYVSEPASIQFKVLPPWYRTWWFRVIIAVVAIGVLYLLFRARTAALRRRQKELEQTVEERTVEVVEQKKEAEKQRDFAQEQHQVAEEQKLIVEEKNKEILDSITYAKRLQEAIMPSPRLFKEKLPDSFLLYLPKDIVAGDFYWMETIKANLDGEERELVFFAAADCTGHGVPGAMVSVVCANALNRAVNEFKLTLPGRVLDKVRELVVKSFDQSEDEIKDGMDIALCAYDITAREIYYAGANNPLYLITNLEGVTDNKYINEEKGLELIEYKASKQPVGKYDRQEDFETTKLALKEGDVIYLFSDGFPDQFGGPKGKKYKYSTFKRFLLQNADLSMEEQNSLLLKEFRNWKQEIEQIDDVCIIGVRV